MPWWEKEHHDPEGMIAICAIDAALADGGRWMKEQLRQMKQNQYVPIDEISEYYMATSERMLYALLEI